MKMRPAMLPIDGIKIGKRFRRDLGDVDGLARSIGDVGLLQPIVVTPNGLLIAGARRLAAVRQLGWAEVPIRIVDLAEIVRGEFAENTARKDFTPSEMVAIARALTPPLQGQARARQGTRTDLLQHPGNLPGREGGRALVQVARFAGVGRRTIEKASAVVDAAEADPESFGDLAARMDKSGKVDGVHRELLRRRTWGERTSVPPPVGTYRTLVVDPPWPYEQRQDDASHGGAAPYPTMALEHIIAETPLPVTDDGWVWLWTTNLHLPNAFRVLDAWGLTYRATFVWVKTGPLGLGEWVRVGAEFVLLATRGDLRPPHAHVGSVSTVFEAPRRKHSEKPGTFYELIERFSPGPWIDIYSRTPRAGCAAWGNEVGFVIGDHP